MNHARNRLSMAVSATVLGLSSTAGASGFAVPEISIAGLGLSNALVANTDEIGAIAYNPAIAALQDGHSVSGGALLVAPSLTVTTATGSHESGGEEVVPIPMMQFAYKWNDQFALTLGVNAPFGLETVWDNTAPVFPGFAGGHPTQSKVQLVDFNPAVAIKLNDNLAVALGADAYWVKEVVFDADIVQNEGDGTAWGWNAALIFDQGPWSFGLSYHSAATVDIEGTSTFPTIPATAPAQADLPVPSRLQAGVRFQVSRDLAVEADITRTGWSDFDTLVISNPISDVTSANAWKDANAYRLGVSYQMDARTQLRFGYSFDETPQPRGSFSARIPDNDRHLFSVGFSRKLEHDMELEAGYMYVKFEEYTHAAAGAGPVAGDPNGSILYNGTYNSDVHIFGLGMTKRF